MSQQYQKMKKKQYELGFQEGKQQGLKKVEELIDKDLEIQNRFFKLQPENRKSIKWRIIGLEYLKQQLKEIK